MHEHWRWVPGGCVGEKNGNRNACNNTDVIAPLGVGYTGVQMGHWGLSRPDQGGQGTCLSVPDGKWEEPVWEDIVSRPVADRLPPTSDVDRRRGNRLQDKLREHQCASRWQNKHSPMATVQTNLKHFCRGSEVYWCTLVPTIPQILAAAISSGLDTQPSKADSIRFLVAAETIYEALTLEEAMVQDLQKQWQQGSHGYVPDVKGNDTIRLGFENANSLSLFNQLRKLINLHN
jgi:hypothetical protein